MIGAARIKRIALFAGLVAAGAVALDLVFAPPLERAGNISTIVADHEGRWLHAFTTPQGRWRFRADLDEIEPAFLERVVLIEDKRFWRHYGVDPAAVVRAGVSSLQAGRIVSGASTITMQTARLLEPRPRTISSKLIEMFRAVQIERRLSKREILELYLTLTPYGGNLEGVRAASLIYFGKEPRHLTDAEQALLIALPQAPEARRPDLKPDNATRARVAMLGELVEKGALSAPRAAEALMSPLPKTRKPLPRYAYHTAQRLAVERQAHEDAIISTLERSLQQRAEALLRAHAQKMSDDASVSLLIIDNKTRAVRAAVGSPGLDTPGGWIDLTGAVRSPGSTLKPFIYALAFDDGLASASTVIDDMPRSFGGYTPENFDRTFRGEVRIREALQHSLNLPAVQTLERVGVSRFSAMMKAAGIALRMPDSADSRPGLALALGGAGVTARDIGALYAALGDGGKVRPLVWTLAAEQQADQQAYQLFSDETAKRVSAILADAPSLAGRAPSRLSASAPRVAFKTGTSYGYRDAWAAGHGAGYSVVVWVGHADGTTRPGQTGRKAAAPLLFEIFDMLAIYNRDHGDAIFEQEADAPGQVMARLNSPARQTAPEIIFPRDGVEVFIMDEDEKARGFALAARGGEKHYRWYVNGDPLTFGNIETGGRTVWRPDKPGFYNVTVVDGAGREAQSKVRVLSAG